MIVVSQQKDDSVVTQMVPDDDECDQFDNNSRLCGAPRIAIFLTVFIVVLLGCSILFVAVYVLHMLIVSASSNPVSPSANRPSPIITRFNERTTFVIQKARDMVRSSSLIEILQTNPSRLREKKITIFPKFYRTDWN